MLKKLFDKSRIAFSVLWIILYCILMSVGDSVSKILGTEKSATLIVCLLLSVTLFAFLKKNGLLEEYGICRPKVNAKKMLYYIPLLLMTSANLWFGTALNYGICETLLYVFSMLLVGFLEEVIFRGLLFNSMAKDNFKAAVIVSSITFGMGHIINLLNGSGMELLPNLMQIIYATAAGFMFVMIYCKAKSLVPCIISHGLFNALSVFANEGSATEVSQIVSCILLAVITGSYAVYLALTLNKEE